MEARPSLLALALTALVILAYLGLIVFEAVAPGAMAMATAMFGTVPLSFVLAFLLILGVVIVTGIYVASANRAEDRR